MNRRYFLKLLAALGLVTLAPTTRYATAAPAVKAYRSYQPSDFDRVIEIANGFIDENPSEVPPGFRLTADLIQPENPLWHCVVYTVDDEVMGFMLGSYSSGTRFCDVWVTAVDTSIKTRQRWGILYTFVQEIALWAQTEGATHVGCLLVKDSVMATQLCKLWRNNNRGGSFEDYSVNGVEMSWFKQEIAVVVADCEAEKSGGV